jgi:hypothetical protein
MPKKAAQRRQGGTKMVKRTSVGRAGARPGLDRNRVEKRFDPSDLARAERIAIDRR